MKRKIFFLLGGLFFYFLNGEASLLSFKMCGGLSWINGGDFNQNIYGWRDYYRDRNKNPYSFKYNMEELQGLGEGRVELLYNFSSHFSLGIGLELLIKQLSGEMRWTLSQKESYFYSADKFGVISIEEQSFQQPKFKLKAVPVILTFYYSFLFGKNFLLSFGAGGGYYFGSLRYREDYNITFDYADDRNEKGTLTRFVDCYSSSGKYSEETTSRAFGFHGSLGVELRVSSRLSLIVEALGRLVNFNSWKGHREDNYSWEHTWGFWGCSHDQGKEQETKEGKLWFGEFYSKETGKSYPRLVFSEDEPSSYRNVREGRINLNGLSIRIGFIIRI